MRKMNLALLWFKSTLTFAITGMVKEVNFLCKLCANFWVKNTKINKKSGMEQNG